MHETYVEIFGTDDDEMFLIFNSSPRSSGVYAQLYLNWREKNVQFFIYETKARRSYVDFSGLKILLDWVLPRFYI